MYFSLLKEEAVEGCIVPPQQLLPLLTVSPYSYDDTLTCITTLYQNVKKKKKITKRKVKKIKNFFGITRKFSIPVISVSCVFQFLFLLRLSLSLSRKTLFHHWSTQPWTSSDSPVTWLISSAFSFSSSKSTLPNHVQVTISPSHFTIPNSSLSLTIDHDFFFSISGVSRKTQELYAIVFLARYLDLFTDFISVYNTFMKIVFIASSLAIVWCMRVHPMVKRSYDKDLDTFRHYLLVAASFLLALFLHEKFTFLEVPFYLWILCFSFLSILQC